MYGKCFDTIYDGTLYGKWEAIVTLQQMVILCNSVGVIDMTPQAIAGRTSIPLEIIQKGIAILSAPDPHSRTPGEEGRRITLLDESRPWGWYLVNHAKYQKEKNREEKLEADRIRVAEKRKANKINNVADCRILSPDVAFVAHAATDAAATTDKSSAMRSPVDNSIIAPCGCSAALLDVENPKPNGNPEHWKQELRKVGVTIGTTESRQAMLGWIRDNIPWSGVIDAVQIVRDRDPKREKFPAAYLDPIVRSPPKPPADLWWTSEEATTKKGRELGLEPLKGEGWPDFRARIRAELN